MTSRVLTTILSAVILAIVTIKCRDRKQSVNHSLPFDVDLLVEKDDLIEVGFIFENSTLELNKREPAVLVSYYYLPTTGLIYTKSTMHFNLFRDTVKLQEWVQDNNGLICAPWITFANNVKKTYVKSKESGLLFSLYIKGNDVITFFDFPDIGTKKRSGKRVIGDDGSVSIQESEERKIYRRDDLAVPTTE